MTGTAGAWTARRLVFGMGPAMMGLKRALTEAFSIIGIDTYLKTASKSTSMGTRAVMRRLDRMAIARRAQESSEDLDGYFRRELPG